MFKNNSQYTDLVAPPVMILGSERSGTNLLRAILESNSKIASPPPAGFVDALAAFDKYYFPNYGPSKIQQLIDDINLLVTTHHNPWGLQFRPQQIIDRIDGQVSFWTVFRALNDIYSMIKGSPVWVSKEPGLFNFLSEISACIPDAKFIYLVRDGRDVASSMLRGRLHAFHVYYAAQAWAGTQRLCLSALAELGSKHGFHLIKYEDLIANPEIEVSKMMEFIGVPFEGRQLRYYENKGVVDHAKRSRFWKNLSKPIDANNSKRYKNHLSKKEIAIFETVARSEMNALGYATETNEDLSIREPDIARFRMISSFKKYLSGLDPRSEAQRSRKRFEKTFEIINRNLRGSQ